MNGPPSLRYGFGVLAAFVAAAGAGLLIYAAFVTPSRIQLMDRRVRDLRDVRALREELRSKQEPALAALAGLPSGRGAPVADLHRSVAGDAPLPEVVAAGDKALSPDWLLRRQQLTYASIGPETLGRLIEAGARAHPPWRLAEVRVDALDGEARAVRAVLVLERPERSAGATSAPPVAVRAPPDTPPSAAKAAAKPPAPDGEKSP